MKNSRYCASKGVNNSIRVSSGSATGLKFISRNLFSIKMFIESYIS